MLIDLREQSLALFKSPGEDNAIFFQWVSVFVKMGIDITTRILVATVPLPVQEFFTSPEWPIDGLLSFEHMEEDGTLVVYASFRVKLTVDDDDRPMEPHPEHTKRPPTRMTEDSSGIPRAGHDLGAYLHHHCASGDGFVNKDRKRSRSPRTLSARTLIEYFSGSDTSGQGLCWHDEVGVYSCKSPCLPNQSPGLYLLSGKAE